MATMSRAYAEKLVEQIGADVFWKRLSEAPPVPVLPHSWRTTAAPDSPYGSFVINHRRVALVDD